MREPTEVRNPDKAGPLFKVRPPQAGVLSETLRVSGEYPTWLETYFLGRHSSIREVRASIIRAAAESWPVLITGETGTGKDMVARAIHAGSRRGRKMPEVVAVGGLGETAWSVLFGHRKGSFTGAVSQHEGVFKAAAGSSILLEDIGDLPAKVQPMLLRALEHGLFRPLGSDRECHSDVRVIATCNLPLEREVAAGRFRPDLYQRLSVLSIKVPPLRDHLEDLEIYVPHFLSKAAAAHRPVKGISKSAMDLLVAHSWPRNVRQLEHFLYRASVEAPGIEIQADDVHRILERAEQAPAPSRGAAPAGGPTREEVIRVIGETEGNKREAARRLGIAPGTLYRLMKKLKIYG
jgi:DNA-binding NtrC family response regulator